MFCEERQEDCTFIKYNAPIRVENKNPLTGETSTNECVCPSLVKLTPSDIAPNICKTTSPASKPLEEKALKLLSQEFPMRIKQEGNDLYVSTVRETQASPLELASLVGDLRMTLIQRAAKKFPPCHVREETLHCLARELLRQLIIECPERGLLYKQVLNEHYKYIDSFKILMQYNDAFMCRKNLQAEYTAASQFKKIRYLEEEIDVLKHQVKALKEAADRLEKKHQEERRRAEIERQNELRYLRLLGDQLKNQIDIFMPSKEE